MQELNFVLPCVLIWVCSFPVWVLCLGVARFLSRLTRVHPTKISWFHQFSPSPCSARPSKETPFSVNDKGNLPHGLETFRRNTAIDWAKSVSVGRPMSHRITFIFISWRFFGAFLRNVRIRHSPPEVIGWQMFLSGNWGETHLQGGKGR